MLTRQMSLQLVPIIYFKFLLKGLFHTHSNSCPIFSINKKIRLNIFQCSWKVKVITNIFMNVKLYITILVTKNGCIIHYTKWPSKMYWLQRITLPLPQVCFRVTIVWIYFDFDTIFLLIWAKFATKIIYF